MSYISAQRSRNKVLVWERQDDGTRICRDYPAPFYCYTEDLDGEYTNIYGKSLVKHTYNSYRELKDAKRGFTIYNKTVFESDINPEFKILSKYYYQHIPKELHITGYDIEVDYDENVGFPRPVLQEFFDPDNYRGNFTPIINTPYAPVNSISIYNFWENKNYLIAIPPNNEDANDIDVNQFMADIQDIEPLDLPTTLEFVNTEEELLLRFLDIINDSDLIFGWNSDTFDNPYIAQRIQIILGDKHFKRLSFQGAKPPEYKTVEVFGEERPIIEFYGRTGTDYMKLYKKFTFQEKPSYKLESIAEEELPKMRKLEYEGSLYNLYRNDFKKFVRYNIRDTEILFGFEEKLGFIELANHVYHSTCGLFQHVFGTLKTTELAMINYCHYECGELDENGKHKGLIVPDCIDHGDVDSIDGAYVLETVAGQHDYIASVDIASLYPSTIRSNNISPDTIVGQFRNTKEDYHAIKQRLSTMIHLDYDKNFGEESGTLSLPANEFPEIFRDNIWSLSGYGTVFDLKKDGILPSILKSWYADRKKTKKLSFDYAKKAESILDKYR